MLFISVRGRVMSSQRVSSGVWREERLKTVEKGATEARNSIVIATSFRVQARSLADVGLQGSNSDFTEQIFWRQFGVVESPERAVFLQALKWT